MPVQIPDRRTRVTCLMDLFEMVYPTVLAAVSSVHRDKANKRINFEAAVTFLIQSCPVMAKQKKRVTIDPNLSSINSASPTAARKSKMGTTGIPLCYHKKEDFVKLNVEQRKEVAAWVKVNPRKREGPKEGSKASKKWESQLGGDHSKGGVDLCNGGVAEGWL